jgi:uncharacterized membrane protein
MTKSRLEAFSDGVLAIIITIMVLEIKVPIGQDFFAIIPLINVFLSYVLSFIYIGIYWNNHHHLMHTITKINGGILWANLHLLFWLSMVPFATGWMGVNNFGAHPMALYGFMLLMSAIAWHILQLQIIKTQGEDSILAKVIGKDIKGKISPILYIIGIFSSWYSPWISAIMYVAVAIMWIVPDKRIEKHLEK